MDRERLGANIEQVRERIRAACWRAGRSEKDVTLVAVTKTVEPAVIEELAGFGITDCGENRAIEGAARVAQVRHAYRWHFIGHLQTNKAKRVVERFSVIHSIDRWDLAEQLEKHLAAADRRMTGFVQVNVSAEAVKGGVTGAEAPGLVDRIRRDCPRIEVLGLMTMAPLTDDPEASRPHFRRLHELAGGCGLSGLSMGMTGDFEVAVEEGATHLRVGTALFEGLAPTRLLP